MSRAEWIRGIIRRALRSFLSLSREALLRTAGQLFFMVVCVFFLVFYQVTYGEEKSSASQIAPTMVALFLSGFLVYSLYRFSLLLFGPGVKRAGQGIAALVRTDVKEKESGQLLSPSTVGEPSTVVETSEELGPAAGQISVLRDKIASVQHNLDVRSSRCSALGKQFAAAALVIPVVTWLVALVVFREEKMANLWALTFSSMTAGSIAIAIGIALMKHAIHLSADAAQTRSDYLHTVALQLAVSIGSREGMKKEALTLVLNQLVSMHAPVTRAQQGQVEKQAIEKVDHNVLLETANQILNPTRDG